MLATSDRCHYVAFRCHRTVEISTKTKSSQIWLKPNLKIRRRECNKRTTRVLL
jgi:hypothetical protein